MHFAKRGLAAGQAEPIEHRLGQALGDRTAHGLEQVEDHLAQPARGETRSAERFVHRRDPADLEKARFGVLAFFGKDLELRLDHFQVAGGARGFDFAEDGYGLPGMKTVLEIGSVKPEALERQPGLTQGEFEQGHAAGAE